MCVLCLDKHDKVKSHCELVANQGLSTEDAVLVRKMTAHTHTHTHTHMCMKDKILVFTLSNTAC